MAKKRNKPADPQASLAPQSSYLAGHRERKDADAAQHKSRIEQGRKDAADHEQYELPWKRLDVAVHGWFDERTAASERKLATAVRAVATAIKKAGLSDNLSAAVDRCVGLAERGGTVRLDDIDDTAAVLSLLQMAAMGSKDLVRELGSLRLSHPFQVLSAKVEVEFAGSIVNFQVGEPQAVSLDVPPVQADDETAGNTKGGGNARRRLVRFATGLLPGWLLIISMTRKYASTSSPS